MSTLKSKLQDGANCIIVEVAGASGYGKNFLWSSDYSKFLPPFNVKKAVNAGDPIWKNSIYSKSSLFNSMNPCNMMRKAIYKIFMSMQHEGLGYCYSKKDSKETWCSYPDGTMEEVNATIAGTGKNPRFINMHIENMHIKEATVHESWTDSMLEISASAHSAASYFYGMILNLVTTDVCDESDEAKYLSSLFNDVRTSYEAGTLATDEEAQKKLTVFENDFLLYLRNIEQGHNTFAMQDSADILEAGKENGTCVYDKNVTTAKRKKKITVIAPTAVTVGEAVKKGIYKISHIFSGDESLVPGHEFDSMELLPQVEEVCALIKSKDFLDTGLSMNFMFTGEAGTGKSTAAQQIAAITGLPYRFITCSSGTDETEMKVQTIVDPNDGSKFVNVDSELVNAVRYGGIIEVQEINMVRRKGVAACLNSVLDGIGKLRLLDGTILKRHPDCVFIFTMNVGYEGAENLNQALLSRCFCKQEFSVPDEKTLVKRLVAKTKIDESLAKDMVKVFFDVRNCLEESGETLGVCSYRELEAWAEVISRNIEIRKHIPTVPKKTPYQAALETLISHATEDKDLQSELNGVVGKTFSNL